MAVPFTRQRGFIHLIPIFILLILVVGLLLAVKQVKKSTELRTNAAGYAPQTQMKEQTALPKPLNIKIYPDDKLATVVWDEPINAAAQNIVGYIVLWGKSTDTTLTNTKQTIHNATQIQPLENGVEYRVEVRAVQGSMVQKPAVADGVTATDTYAFANGNVSLPVTLTTTPTRARVDSMRQRLTGFFDDFDLPAGAFDEKKWNFATTACAAPGEAGQFVNNQFHAHNMLRSYLTCDRAANVSRARAVFNIAGRTEANPGQIEFDLDGVSQPRDIWYLDIIPADARKSGIPIDVTSHIDNSSAVDPGRMLRIFQGWQSMDIEYYDANNNYQKLVALKPGMPCKIVYSDPTLLGLGNCDMTKKTAGLSPLAEPTYPLDPVIPNVRRHWIVQFSHDKLKVFIDSTLIAESDTPPLFANIDQYVVHSTLFSYNTGKGYTVVVPTTSMLHWDNFGFTAPLAGPSNIVTHNYLDGGPAGTTPMIGRGPASDPIPNSRTQMKINIPDSLGTAVGKARLMFTLQPFYFVEYQWKASDHIVVNGKRYDFPNPWLNIQSQNITLIAQTNRSHSTGIFIDPADLKQGMNDITFNIPSSVINMHLELDYDKNNEPTFTQPKDVFKGVYEQAIRPVMRTNDDYWFVEQNMGLVNGMVMSSEIATPTAPPSVMPTVSVTATPVVLPTPTPHSSVVPTPTPTMSPMPSMSPTPTATATIAPSPPTITSTLIIYAAGQPGGIADGQPVYPLMHLTINGKDTFLIDIQKHTRSVNVRVKDDYTTRTFGQYKYISPAKLDPSKDLIQVWFNNDFWDPTNHQDRNLMVDKIVLDGKTYETESPSVYGSGLRMPDNTCGWTNNTVASEWLNCAGYFQFR